MKKDKALCNTKWCRNKKAKGKSRCSKCCSRRYKENRPAHYYFNVLRSNAKRRGKTFELTLDQFKQFCQETGYLEKKGTNGHKATIDRIDSRKGYSIDNIQVLSHYENSKKQNNDVPF